MINDGIYEQIVNEKLQKELNQLDLNKYDIDLDKIDADDARKILTIYISYILQKGMRYVRDNYGASKEQDALVAQIRLCNEIIDDIEAATGEKDFQDLKILDKGEVLRSLYKKINTARDGVKLRVIATTYIGSSNLSNPALTEGLEWNIKVTEKNFLILLENVKSHLKVIGITLLSNCLILKTKKVGIN